MFQVLCLFQQLVEDGKPDSVDKQKHVKYGKCGNMMHFQILSFNSERERSLIYYRKFSSSPFLINLDFRS